LNGQCDVSDAVKLVTSSEGIARAEALADRYIGKALAALDTLPDIRSKKQLRDIANFITKRSY
ncbi:heptaprenyl diphosphate synthase, partial [Paenibacillus glucanolyticus]